MRCSQTFSGDTIVIAHHPYEPQREDELQLAKGDRVIVTDSSDPDWWVGKKEDGTSGYFPSNASITSLVVIILA